MFKKLGFLMIVAVAIMACATPPNSVEKKDVSFGTCPVVVRVILHGVTSEPIQVGELELVADGYEGPENINSGNDQWLLKKKEWNKFYQYFDTDVDPLTNKLNQNITSVFGGPVLKVRESRERSDVLIESFGAIAWGECPANGFQKEISLNISDVEMQAFGIDDGKVYLRYQSEAGSIFEFWLSERIFKQIVFEGYKGYQRILVSVEPESLSSVAYSDKITSLLVNQTNNNSEMGSYTIVSHDTYGRTRIYDLVNRILRYIPSDITRVRVLNTLDNDNMLGTIIVNP